MPHLYKLKPYYVCEKASPDSNENSGVKSALCANTEVSFVLFCSLPTELLGGEEWPHESVLQAGLNNSEALQALPSSLGHLDEDKRSELISLINAFPTLFSDTPSQTHLIEHDIDVGDIQPSSSFIVFHQTKEPSWLKRKIAEPSNSSWASPCLLVKKPDSTMRPCTDYRRLNSVTKPDGFPLPQMEDCRTNWLSYVYQQI